MLQTFLALLLLFVVSAKKPPNILIIIADDLGYGDVGCFGNKTIPTPSIDKLASQGARLTHHLAASSLCTPSRSALLTGRYPARTGMVPTPPSRIGIILFLATSAGLPQSEVTIAEQAKSKGYRTGLIGKWHLGLSESKYNDNIFHPNNQGFDYYYGHPLTNVKDWYNDGSSVLFHQNPRTNWYALTSVIVTMLTMYLFYKKEYIGLKIVLFVLFLLILFWSYFYFTFLNMILLNSLLYRNLDIVEQPINLETLSERYTKESIEFLENSTNNNAPFLLVVSWNHVHTALITSKKFRGKSKHGRYGDAVEELDYGTGQIVSKLDELGLTDDTLVYFTSDNGAHLEERGMHGEIDGGINSPFKGGKGHPAVDGGIRVPSIVRFPNQIQKNIDINEPTTQMDMFTTISNLIEADIPKDRHIDGKDIMPLMKQKENITPSPFLYHYCNNEIHAMRYRPPEGNKVWKLVFKEPNYMPGQEECEGLACLCRNAVILNPPVFYELTSDLGERKPIPSDSSEKYRNLRDIMTKELNDHVTSVGTINSQLTVRKLLWNPFLQPCCNFPTCKCTDPKYS
ncbi:steryl-sulfatase-like isoform X2 [Mytilus californianus]|uniref:steryl-sulfatase-like isoform X2 n=1 Tax=Mytilus californianus TaxID=6549 RepID=UPI002245E575|nr:steryl-sulfatase-like isoform X2 [Mytilus californianus]